MTSRKQGTGQDAKGRTMHASSTGRRQGRRGRRLVAATAVTLVAVGGGGLAWAGSAHAGARKAVVAPHALDGFAITASPAQVKVGDTVTVTVSATQATSLYAYDLGLSFDPDALSYDDDSVTTEDRGATYTTSKAAGTLDVVHTELGSSPADDGDVTLATLTFTAASEGETSVEVPSLVQVADDDTSTTTADVASTNVEVDRLDAPVASKAPVVTGTAMVGRTLRATAPVWSVDGVTTSYQWLKDGKPVAGATGATYVPARGVAGHAVSVEVTGTKAHYADADVTTSAKKVAPATTRTGVTVKRLADGKHVKVTVTVTAQGVVPVGHLQLKVGSRTPSRAALRGGKASHVFTVRLLTSRATTLRVRFLPATGLAASSKVKHLG